MELLRSSSNPEAKEFVSLLDNPTASPYGFICKVMSKYPALKEEGKTEMSQHCVIEFLPYILEYVAVKPVYDVAMTSQSSKRICKHCTNIVSGSVESTVLSFVPSWKESIETFKREKCELEAYCETCRKNTQQGRINFRRRVGDVVFIAPMHSEGKPVPEFTLNLVGKSAPAKYELVAACHHGGDPSTGARGGHWFAYVRENSKWYNANDSSVTESEVGNNCNLAAYIRVTK